MSRDCVRLFDIQLVNMCNWTEIALLAHVWKKLWCLWSAFRGLEDFAAHLLLINSLFPLKASRVRSAFDETWDFWTRPESIILQRSFSNPAHWNSDQGCIIAYKHFFFSIFPRDAVSCCILLVSSFLYWKASCHGDARALTLSWWYNSPPSLPSSLASLHTSIIVGFSSTASTLIVSWSLPVCLFFLFVLFWRRKKEEM